MSKQEDLQLLEKGNTENGEPIQSDESLELARHVQWLFKMAWDAKQQLNLNQLWRMCDDYKHNRQNPKQSPEHPGSVTNVIHRIVESQIADLIDKPYSSAAKGWEPGDDMFAEQAQNMIDFILYRNKFKDKINLSEHDRLELGTTIIKVWFDEDELDGRGLPVFESISPANFFYDPKVVKAHDLQKGEFVIHATPKPLSWFRNNFKLGKYVQREVAVPYNPQEVWTDDRTDEVHVPTSQKALLLECYLRDEDGEVYCLHVANNILLEDSREKLKGKKLQRRNLFPFRMINCYPRRGTAWGMGDVELLIPTQDLINELDDQIRMNARLSGNPQIVVGMGAGKGFDFRKWTNKPGLRVPMRDHTAFKIVEPMAVSRDVPVRREKAFQEADLIAGTPDVNRGEQPGQVTAAAAIMALQQAGQKTVVHKNEMFKAGWADVLEMLFDEALTHWDEEMWIRIDGEKPDWKFMNPKEFRNVPRLIPNELNGVVDDEDSIKQLTDDDGVPMTRDAMFDFQLNMGNGFPNDRSFMLQMLTDFAKLSFPDGPTITRAEMRKFLKEQVGMDLEDDQQQQPEMGMPPGGPLPPGLPPGMPQPLMPEPAPMPMQQAPPPQGPTPEIPPELIAAIMQGGVPIG